MKSIVSASHEKQAMPPMSGEPMDSDGLEARVRAVHANKLKLCADLEAIADSLPDDVDPKMCLAMARALPQILARAHSLENDELFPFLLMLRPGDKNLAASLERLRYEHWEDESYSEEVSSELLDCAMCTSRRTADATGYLLRGFFEGLRRHIAFEQEHILPMISEARKLS
ncbi:MAG: hemerythrin domain-containing protein [Rhizobiaceae bacterium]